MPRRSQGFTLVELLVVVAITAILLALVVPSFTDSLARRKLEGAANELSADLRYARTQAVSDNVSVTLATTGTTGYTISGNQTYKTATLDSQLSLSSGISIVFFPLRGCTTATCSSAADTITLTSSRTTGSLSVRTNNLGRVEICVPSGSSFTGYSACS